MNNFHRLEVEGRGSETQLQVDENLNNLLWRFKGEMKLLVVVVATVHQHIQLPQFYVTL